MTENEEKRLQGFPISEGIAIGVPYFLHHSEEELPSFEISLKEVDEEIKRYRSALGFSREDLRQIHSNLIDEGSKEAATIIDTHIQMLEDPLMTTHMEGKIRQMLRNTESVFRSVISDYEVRCSQHIDPVFQEKSVDVVDVAKRVLGHLYVKKQSKAEIPFNSVIFTEELIPSYTAVANPARVAAFVTKSGGGNSHAALIARAKGIPYVSCIDLTGLEELGAKSVVVDGQTGEVVFNPTPETLSKYRQRKTCLKTSQQILQKEVYYDAETVDGCQVQVFANVGSVEDFENFETLGAEGIGLFRTEYLFFERSQFFSSEQEQYHTYVQLIQKAGDAPVTIRVFDVGGDKNPELFSKVGKEPNPVLGCRGIRFLLRYPDIFKTQLRAILRASLHGDVRILLPLISDVGEIEESRRIIREVARSLLMKGVPVNQEILVGSMVEVPSSVIVCDAIAERSDFLSIGTNDLVQYTLGVDRSNPGMSDLCYPAHPSVIRMIKMVSLEAKRNNKSVAICGEIASNPLFVPLLLGLGIHQFSCSPRYIPSVKRAIRKTALLKAFELAERVLGLSSSQEVSQVLMEEYNSMEG